MKKAGCSFATILLFFVLTNVAFAGQMDTTTPTPPPPPPPTGNGQMDTTARAAGQIYVPQPAVTVGETAAPDTVADLAFNIWQLLPSIF